MENILKKSGHFVSPDKWEQWNIRNEEISLVTQYAWELHRSDSNSSTD